MAMIEEQVEDDFDWLVGSGVTHKPVLRFDCSALTSPPVNPPARRLHMTFKVVQAESRLMSAVLRAHGLVETREETLDFNLLWTGLPPKPEVFTTLGPHQRINHFPRSLELTRKDLFAKHFAELRHSRLSRHFDFVPETFLLPTDYREFCVAHKRSRCTWIVKPIASSRGRGISVVTSLAKVPSHDHLVVAKYIDNPLLIHDRKWDLRLYVAVTSFNPLVVYLYEEGLVRFATVKYTPGGQQLWNPCMHLCNYSLNKYHTDYVTSDDPHAEDVGHKWTMSALLHHLRSRGCDTTTLMCRVEELIVKSLMVVAPTVASAVKLFVRNRRNCFDVYGFDILVDDNLKPWLLEVNYSPSFICDSSLDMRVKSAVLVDLLTLVGLTAVDPVLRPEKIRIPRILTLRKSTRAHSAVVRGVAAKKSVSNLTSLNHEKTAIVKALRAEFKRRGGFVRIFPTPDSWQRYGSILDPTTGFIESDSSTRCENTRPVVASQNYNLFIHQALFPEVHRAQEMKAIQYDLSARIDRYERPLTTGHMSLMDEGLGSEQRDSSDCLSERTLNMLDSLHAGRRLDQWQTRRLFSEFLDSVLQRGAPPEQILQFLCELLASVRSPYRISAPPRQLKGKDREAVVLKTLHDFLSDYNHDTELRALRDQRPQFVSRQIFQEFLNEAGERDLEVVLSLNTTLYKGMHLYLGRCGAGGMNPFLQSHAPALSSILQAIPSTFHHTTTHLATE